MERIIAPDKWVLVHIEEDLWKVFGTWTSDGRWKINSGIESVELQEDGYVVNGFSGSRYLCREGRYGFAHSYGEGILTNMCDNHKSACIIGEKEAKKKFNGEK